MKEKILVSIDGAEESLVTAWLLKKQGYQLRAVTFDIVENPEHKETLKKHVMDFERKLGIPIQILECAREARQLVENEVKLGVDRGFRYDIKAIFHQRFLFPKLMVMKNHFGFDKIATGHRVNVNFEPLENHMKVHRYHTHVEDESHLLIGLEQKELKSMEFPLGSIPRAMIHKLAEELKLDSNGTTKLAKFEIQHQKSSDSSGTKPMEAGTEPGVDLITLGNEFMESLVFDILPGQKAELSDDLADRQIKEIWLDNASWFSGSDIGFSIKNCLMSWKNEVQPVPVKILQYEGRGIKVLLDHPLTGANANLFSGENVIWLEGDEVLGGARVVKCL